MRLGVFIPIGNNGWLISTTSPQYMPTFDLNRTIVEKAKHFDFDFALSMIKLHGFGGPSQFWEHNLESFTLMAGLAAVTKRMPTNQGVLVGSYASVARMLDELSEVPGVRGVMLTFDDFVTGIEQFGARIMPLMRCLDGAKRAA
jgi:pyrimidine oxygenase